MRFLIAVLDSVSPSGSGNEMEAIDAFNDSLQANGHWIIAVGIAAPSTAVLIDNRNDAGSAIEAPLYDNPEFMSGFWLIHAADLEEAKALAAAGSKACNRRVELRPLLG